jgi:hypothetical protein
VNAIASSKWTRAVSACASATESSAVHRHSGPPQWHAHADSRRKSLRAETTRGAIVGGTGGYAGATGSFTSSDESGTNKPSRDTFQLFIPQQ